MSKHTEVKKFDPLNAYRAPRPPQRVSLKKRIGLLAAGTAIVVGGAHLVNDAERPTELPQPGTPAAEAGIANGTLEEIVIPKNAVAEKIARGREADGDLEAGILAQAKEYNQTHGIEYEGLHPTAPLVVPVREQPRN